MMPTPFREVTCARCERVFSVAGAVDPDDWRCESCEDEAAQAAVERESARYYSGASWRDSGRAR